MIWEIKRAIESCTDEGQKSTAYFCVPGRWWAVWPRGGLRLSVIVYSAPDIVVLETSLLRRGVHEIWRGRRSSVTVTKQWFTWEVEVHELGKALYLSRDTRFPKDDHDLRG